MPQVETVGGAIDTRALGPTLMHEHIFILTPEVLDNFDVGWDEEREVAEAVTKLDQLKERGIDTIVDLTVIGLGRYLPRVKRVADQTRMQIVAATGVYTYNDVPLHVTYRGLFAGGGIDLMTDWFVRDIEEGVGDTGVRAGILKCATDEPGVTPGVEMVLRAVARAHRRTGVPISTHTHAGLRRGLDQQRIFDEEGVDLGRVVIGHSGDTTDLDYLEELIARGSWLGMDRFGVDVLLGFEQRVQIVADLCERGHAGRMVLSHDAMCFSDWFPSDAIKAAAPNWHYTHITDDVVPALKERGVTDDQVHQMLVDNPRAIFEQQGAY